MIFNLELSLNLDRDTLRSTTTKHLIHIQDLDYRPMYWYVYPMSRSKVADMMGESGIYICVFVHLCVFVFVYMGQFLQDGENGCFVSYFFQKVERLCDLS